MIDMQSERVNLLAQLFPDGLQLVYVSLKAQKNSLVEYSQLASMHQIGDRHPSHEKRWTYSPQQYSRKLFVLRNPNERRCD